MTIGYWYRELSSGKFYKLLDTCTDLSTGAYGVLIVEKDSSVGAFYYEYCNVKYLDRGLFKHNFVEVGTNSDLDVLLSQENVLLYRP